MSDTRTSLNGARVLILEDEYYLASDIQDALEAAGTHVVGPFSEPAEAHQAASAGPLDCALVDLNLGNGISFELPRELARLGVPFAFITGYDQAAIPEDFAGVTRVEKPLETWKVIELVEALLLAQRA